LLKFKISRIPKYFRPYAELHFKKAAQDDLPDSVRNNPRHVFHHFHRLGYQQWYVKRYRAILTALLQNMEVHMETLKKEQFRYEKSCENFYDFMYNEPDTYFTPEKNQKNEKKQNPRKSVLLLVPILFMSTQMILSKFFEQTIYFHLDEIMKL
jgi:hypothetical protein